MDINRYIYLDMTTAAQQADSLLWHVILRQRRGMPKLLKASYHSIIKFVKIKEKIVLYLDGFSIFEQTMCPHKHRSTDVWLMFNWCLNQHDCCNASRYPRNGKPTKW